MRGRSVLSHRDCHPRSFCCNLRKPFLSEFQAQAVSALNTALEEQETRVLMMLSHFFSHYRSWLEKVGRMFLWRRTDFYYRLSGLLCSLVAPEAMPEDLLKHITKIEDYPVNRGGYGDIWKCIYRADWGPTTVAVKSLRVYAAEEDIESREQMSRGIQHELDICAHLGHPNILPVYGYTTGFSPFIAIVSPWAENGNLETYLNHEDANLPLVKRLQILRDIIAGLQYLHAHDVIHGDLSGQNVLIHGDGTACLADFGLSLWNADGVSITRDSWKATYGNFRWLAPELLGDLENDLPVLPTKYSDIYSFGGIMLQVLTSKVPYYYYPRKDAVVLCIIRGEKPDRSRYPAFSDEYWRLIEECWSAVPADRPSAERILEVISNELDALASSSVDS